MTIFKTWISAYIIHASFYLFFPDGFAMAIFVAVFSLLGSLIAIPALFVFWSLFTQDVYSKPYILTWSCIAAVAIATAGSVATIGVFVHDLSWDTIKREAMFIYLPAFAAILSILINHNSIYNYTQAHLHDKEN